MFCDGHNILVSFYFILVYVQFEFILNEGVLENISLDYLQANDFYDYRKKMRLSPSLRKSAGCGLIFATNSNSFLFIKDFISKLGSFGKYFCQTLLVIDFSLIQDN